MGNGVPEWMSGMSSTRPLECINNRLCHKGMIVATKWIKKKNVLIP